MLCVFLAIILSLVMSPFQEIRYLVTCDPVKVFWQQDGTKANLHRNMMTTKQDGLQVPSEHSATHISIL